MCVCVGFCGSMHKLSRGGQLRLICRRQLLVVAAFVVTAVNVDVVCDVGAASACLLLLCSCSCRC